MGSEREDGLYSPSCGIIYQECQHHRQGSSFEESLAERPGIRHANAHLLHQPGGSRALRRATGRTEKSEGPPFKTDHALRESAQANKCGFLTLHGVVPGSQPPRDATTLISVLPYNIVTGRVGDKGSKVGSNSSHPAETREHFPLGSTGSRTIRLATYAAECRRSLSFCSQCI